MKIIDQSWDWLNKPDSALERIEKAGRTCYKSEDRINPGSSGQFAKMLINRGHVTVIEHVSASLRLITNRGVTHELVRHRLCSFSQESTRYVRYDGSMEFIRPVWWDQWIDEEKKIWTDAMEKAESAYLALTKLGSRPEQAREVLPNSLKTEIVITANLREWRHIFNLRCAKQAHPQIRLLMLSILKGFHEAVPVIFADLHDKYL
ncbi:FAD-dependent thymidylate synthase [Desulfobacterales bacterium HSG16]|nr:FAD-dependent thymidylate synthase [Desulfobacterales bacterium HSG16]